MVVSSFSPFDDVDSPLALNESPEEANVVPELLEPKKSSLLWGGLAFVIVASSSLGAGYFFGISANGNHREVFNHYVAYFGLDSVPTFNELIVDNYNDNSAYAVEYDRLENTNGILEDILKSVEEENRYLVMAKDSLENVLDGELLEFENEDLGFSFEYPAKFGEVKLTIEDDKYRASFLNNPYFKFGAASVNYDEGSKVEFLDYGRFDGKGFIGNAKLLKTIKVDGVSVSIYQGVDSYKGALRRGELGALLDFEGGDFGSLALLSTDKDKFNLQAFEAIVTTLNFN